MSKNPRDTQFAVFAQRLLHEMLHKEFPSVDIKFFEASPLTDMEQIIARRAYDLAEHTVGYCLEYLHECGFELSGSMNSRIQPTIPDMTTWTKGNE